MDDKNLSNEDRARLMQKGAAAIDRTIIKRYKRSFRGLVHYFSIIKEESSA